MNIMPSYVFSPKMEEVLSGRLRLRYSAACDTYFRDRQDIINPDSMNSTVGWKSLVFVCDNIERVADKDSNEVYLDRLCPIYPGRISWKFDFSSCGLVVDYIMLNVDSNEIGGGQTSINFLGNGGNKFLPYMGGEYSTALKGLEESTVVTLTMDLIGESKHQMAKLFKQDLFKSDGQCSFDLTIRLKRPDYTIGRSLILLGLMYSTKPDEAFLHKKKVKSIRPTGEGFLHVHVNQAKRLPHRTSGSLPDPQVKCVLQEGDKKMTCKTRRLKKTTNPIWDEHLIMEGITREDLKGQLFDILVYHFTIGITKKREILGRVTIGWGSDRYVKLYDSLDHSDHEDENQNEVTELKMDSSLPQSTDKDDGQKSLQEQFENLRNESINNGHIFSVSSTSISKEDLESSNMSISMPSLSGSDSFTTADYSEYSFDSSSENSNSNYEYPRSNMLKRKSLAKIFGIRNTRAKQAFGAHPTIIVSNSIESVVILKSRGMSDAQGKERIQKSNGLRRKARSLSNLLNSHSDDEEFYKRRETLSPCPSGGDGWANLLEGDYLTKSAVALAARQWRTVYNEPNNWVYCWHPIF